jgi:LmbE family N-acetylglucosaminyl deacetylase
MLAGARLLSYPVWGWALPPRQRLDAGTIAGVRIDIAAQLPAKRRAIAAHASQHGAVVADDPRGFRLPATLLAALDQPFEVFLVPR